MKRKLGSSPMVCAKCKECTGRGGTIVEGGIGYVFCDSCYDFLVQQPPGSIQGFLTPSQRESQADRNIREAREKRSRGESLWRKREESARTS